MTDAARVAALARALADESRAAMCLAMMDGCAWTVTELADVAKVSMATASEHVSRLVAAGLARDDRTGRNRYVRLAGHEVASALETFIGLSAPLPATSPSSLRGVGERHRLAVARTCYDHLAGRLGVTVMDALVERRIIDASAGLVVTPLGEGWFDALGVDVPALRSRRRTLVRACVDWTEHRPHLAGALGAELCDTFLDRQWVRRTDRTRRLEVTGRGERSLRDLLGIAPTDLRVAD